MARQRSPNRDRAKEIYINNNGNITNKSIAELLGEKEKTVSNWKSRDKWESSVVLQTNECSTTNKRGAQKKNRNALGNKGGSAPKQNSNAVTHGFFRKHFPEDVADLAAEIMEKNPIDMLWENITIQYTAIIRAQRLMFVKDQEDMSREIKKETDMGTEYEIQFAWDKHANFLNAQSRAMSTLSSLIRDFDKLANIDDERRAKLSLMNAQIDKLKADINKEDKDVLRVQIIDDVPQDDDDV
ncbi:phage terminase small subunit [Bacillus wiedmannii]|uniref:phage terminase small subunit n=1 Tax=Bacillus wiedmannii TaxID=1890302 RepID=UPI000BF93884|nr:phage terminase small subunit [Bacillus wiedmannii]PGC57638.1 hypothetical protein COM22_11775 [Bacillus wiedmannii]